MTRLSPRSRPPAHVAAVLTGLVVATLLAGACAGDNAGAGVADGPVEPLEAAFVPSEMLGLTVEREPVDESLGSVTGSYVDAVDLFGLRDGDQLVATLQVGRFGDEVDHASSGFRRALLGQIGGAQPEATRLGDQTVWFTTSVTQRLAVWFEGSYLFILGVREEHDRPRTLVREALAIDPGSA